MKGQQAKADLIKELRIQASIAREERAKVDALFASIGEGVIATNEEGKVFKVNQAALTILGFQKGELLGKWFPGTVTAMRKDGSIIEPVDRPVTRAFLSGQVINTRIMYRKKNGKNIPIALTVSPIMSRNKPVGAIEVFRDITLEERSDEMKTEFISVASHQLRTPLAAVNTYSHMLAEGYVGDLSEDQKSFMTIILSAAHRMNELIGTLLNITRIEAGSIMVDPSPTQFDGLLQELIAEFRPQIDERRLKFKAEIDPRVRVTKINTDPLLVREIMSNLLSNAIKYTPEGGSITPSLRIKDQKLLLSVQDTGYGIPVTAQPLIFTKFFRASNILTTEVSGTGLGLYLIKILAENLGGDVWFNSVENRGSVFYFSLPLQGSPAKTGTFRLDA